MPAAQHKLCLLILTAPGSGQEPRRHVDTQLSLFLSLALMSPPCQAMPCPSPFPTAPPARRPQVGPWVTAGHPRVSLPPLCTSNPVSHGIPLFWGQDPRSIGPSHPTGSPPSSAHTAPSCARPEASRSPLVAPSAPGPRACVLAVPHVWNAFPSPLHLRLGLSLGSLLSPQQFWRQFFVDSSEICSTNKPHCPLEGGSLLEHLLGAPGSCRLLSIPSDPDDSSGGRNIWSHSIDEPDVTQLEGGGAGSHPQAQLGLQGHTHDADDGLMPDIFMQIIETPSDTSPGCPDMEMLTVAPCLKMKAGCGMMPTVCSSFPFWGVREKTKPTS
ncbi:unnamed protein product [Nyctereutes procyonoides]|uniref:(raccoon dog) hypothetical protein n=1 Tax=Nyctereutes procyonoides TaxID=34880 RepID=A0A811YIL5_NYCPR|nr:unnamed protein product [Nyctereutes procyonoides]